MSTGPVNPDVAQGWAQISDIGTWAGSLFETAAKTAETLKNTTVKVIDNVKSIKSSVNDAGAPIVAPVAGPVAGSSDTGQENPALGMIDTVILTVGAKPTPITRTIAGVSLAAGIWGLYKMARG